MLAPLAVTSYDVSLWLHITAAVVGLGATFAESVLFPVAMRSDTRSLPYVHRVQLAINRYLANPALLLIVLTGFYQVFDRDWELGDFWLSATFAIVIVIGGIVGSYFIPTDKKLAAMLDDEIAAAGPGEFAPSEAYLSKARAEGIVGAVTGLLIVVVIFLMVAKPGL